MYSENILNETVCRYTEKMQKHENSKIVKLEKNKFLKTNSFHHLRLIHAKNQNQKISCKCTFKILPALILAWQFL
jgi:hypothetical protein